MLGVTASGGRVELVLGFDPGEPVRTSDTPGLVSSVRSLLPGIVRHRCTSPESGMLVSEICDTEIAHLVEHVALELMVLAGSPRTLGGRTQWDFARDGQGVYRVTVDAVDASLGEAAARKAAGLVSGLLRGGRVSELEALVESLRQRLPDGA